jgi:multidrug efflux pump subunit AcrB
MLRFRPILMTTMAALFGALPLAFGTGTGSSCAGRSASRSSAG